MRRVLALAAVLLGTLRASGQQPETVLYAVKDSCSLYMDIYYSDIYYPERPTLLFLFGGGFSSGSRSDGKYLPFFREMNKRGYTVVSADYRKGLDKDGRFGIGKLRRAVDMAVSDLFSATAFIIRNAQELELSPQLVLVGSSAGAITALQADYELCNRSSIAGEIPKGYRFAGVVSYAGGILTSRWGVSYRCYEPAPAFFLHGTEDRTVPYRSFRLLNVGMLGTNPLARHFRNKGYPYYAIRYAGKGHEVAGFMTDTSDELEWFLREMVENAREISRDVTLTLPEEED